MFDLLDISQIISLISVMAVAASISGFMAGLLGVGGGIIMVPALYYAFTVLGYDESTKMHLALGTSLAIIIPTSVMSTRTHMKYEAVDFASRVLIRFIASASGGISAKEIVAKAIDSADDPRVIVLEKYTPWKRTVHALSKEALYMVYPSQTGQWRIQTVPVEPGSFENRKSLPDQWAGLSDKELREVTGIDDAMFCHNGLFIAGAESFESTMKMASIALKE